MKKVLIIIVLILIVDFAKAQHTKSYVEFQQGQTIQTSNVRIYVDSKDTTKKFRISCFVANKSKELYVVPSISRTLRAKKITISTSIGCGVVAIDSYTAYIKDISGINHVFENKSLIPVVSGSARIAVSRPKGDIYAEGVYIYGSLNEWYRLFIIKKINTSGFEIGVHIEKSLASGVRVSQSFELFGNEIKISLISGYKDFSSHSAVSAAAMSLKF